MKIAVYTIALNEEKFVERWAESCKDADYRLILDNGSTDGTFDALCDIQKQYKFGKKIKIIRNKKNLGYTNNFIKLFKSSDTKYLLVTSDEDFIVKKNFYLLKKKEKLKKLIKKKYS